MRGRLQIFVVLVLASTLSGCKKPSLRLTASPTTAPGGSVVSLNVLLQEGGALLDGKTVTFAADKPDCGALSATTATTNQGAASVNFNTALVSTTCTVAITASSEGRDSTVSVTVNAGGTSTQAWTTGGTDSVSLTIVRGKPLWVYRFAALGSNGIRQVIIDPAPPATVCTIGHDNVSPANEVGNVRRLSNGILHANGISQIDVTVQCDDSPDTLITIKAVALVDTVTWTNVSGARK